MIKTIKYTSYFHNKNKHEIIIKIDSYIRELKNKMSLFVKDNIEELINIGEMNFYNKYYKQFHNDYIIDYETQTLLKYICTFYMNYINSSLQNKRLYIQKEVIIKRYKRRINNHNIGDVKDYSIKRGIPEKRLYLVLKYLIQVQDSYINKIKNPKILDILNSYTSNKRDRVIKLSRLIRSNILNNLNVIVFTTGTFMKKCYSSNRTNSFIKDDTNIKYKY